VLLLKIRRWHGSARMLMDDVESQWKTWNSTRAIQKRENRWSPKFAWVITSGYLLRCKISLRCYQRILPSRICKVAYQMFTRLVFWGSSNSLVATSRPLRRFWRSLRWKTSFRAIGRDFSGSRKKNYVLTPFS